MTSINYSFLEAAKALKRTSKVWTFKNILCLGKTSKKALRFLKF
jgi:hypothetical protein